MNVSGISKKLLGIIVATAVISSSNMVALAETVYPTHEGQTVQCTLNAYWFLTSNDNANARTKLSSAMSGHTLGVRLYYKDNSSDSWHIMDGDVDTTYAYVSGSRAGVWEFLSEHYIYHVDNNNTITSTVGLTSLSDW